MTAKKEILINFKSRYKDQATVINKPFGDERNRLMNTGKKWDEYVNAEYVEKLEEALRLAHKHCLCGRRLSGFDYGEKHGRLGKPAIGTRWNTPRDIIARALPEVAND